MKKLKFMLLSFTLIAAVGGALAFKATYNTSYCTAPLPEGNSTCGDPGIFCPEEFPGKEIISGQATLCTAPTQGVADPCPDDLNCVAPARLQGD